MQGDSRSLLFSDKHRILRLFWVCVAGIALGFALGNAALFYYHYTPNPVSVEEMVTENATSTSLFARSAPVHLSIPRIKLEADFEAPLGLNEERTIEVPESYTKVGWYEQGATPGEVGTASVLGHVDSYLGPAVFWPLQYVKEGDTIEITREDGTTAVFEVKETKMYNQDNFPTEEVYAHTDYPSLRLITCTGTYNRGTQRYSHNLVVFADLVTEAQ